jgi:hypothetical protein
VGHEGSQWSGKEDGGSRKEGNWWLALVLSDTESPNSSKMTKIRKVGTWEAAMVAHQRT